MARRFRGPATPAPLPAKAVQGGGLGALFPLPQGADDATLPLLSPKDG